MNFRQLFYPESVAVIGSMSRGKLGSELVRQIQTGGYTGSIFTINPKGEGAPNAQGFSSITEISKPVDLAIIASPAATVAQVLDDCGRTGIKAAVIITSGFSEIGNRIGEQEIIDVAKKYGILFNGPNSAGIVNTWHCFYPTLEIRPPVGKVAFVSQSGAIGGLVLGWAEQKGLGISKFVSYGNAAGINESDLLEYLSTDEETSVVAIYIESVKNGRRFMKVLSDCCKKKPVIVIKAGRTSAGERATASHTGSMAGSDMVYDVAFRQSGAIRANSVEKMLDLCEGFLNLPAVRGTRILIVTNSGGPGVLTADRAEENGLEVKELSKDTQENLKTFLPGHCSLKNPIDLTVEGTKEGYQKTLLTALDEYDAAVAINIATPYLDSAALAEGVSSAAQAKQKPVLTSFLPDQLVADGVTYLKNHGIPNYVSGERAVDVLADMAQYYSCKNRTSNFELGLIPNETQPLPGSPRILEPEAMDWLRENGIPTPQYLIAKNGEEAVIACNKMGYPVVMKVVSPDILHKSDVGGVKVNIINDSDARKAFTDIAQSAQGKEFQGAIIYQMVKGAQEVLVGLSNDPQFGPVIMFGLGGIYTEIWKDVSLRVAPVNLVEARCMIREIKSIKLLQGVRGQQACDLEALAEMLVKFSCLPFEYSGIKEIDLNPVFLFPGGMVVGDARVIRI